MEMIVKEAGHPEEGSQEEDRVMLLDLCLTWMMILVEMILVMMVVTWVVVMIQTEVILIPHELISERLCLT